MFLFKRIYIYVIIGPGAIYRKATHNTPQNSFAKKWPQPPEKKKKKNVQKLLASKI
jgi:hypothetical protein